jgi:hypothetical protein
VKERIDQGLHVDGVVERLAHAAIRERIGWALGHELDELQPRGRARHDLIAVGRHVADDRHVVG